MQRGFSLVEIIIVLACLAIFGGVAAINFSSCLARFEVTGAAQVFASDIRWLQQVTINSTSTEGEVVVIPELLMRQVPPYGYLIIGQNSASIRHYEFPPTVIIGSNANNLSFKTNGRPAAGSDLTFVLKSTRDNRISKKVIVQMITGRVRVE